MTQPPVDINVALRDFVASEFDPADPYRWAEEPCRYPRDNAKGEKDIRPVNCNALLEQGFGIRKRRVNPDDNHPDDIEEHIYFPSRFDKESSRGPFVPLRCSLDYEFGHKRKKWHFLCYSQGAFVTRFSFDVDRKPHTSENEFWGTVRKIESLGLPGIWTSSPGYQQADGYIRQGLYFHVYLTTPCTITELQPLARQIRRILGLPGLEMPNIDLNRHGMTGNYRFPGQYNCDAVTVDSDNEFFVKRSNSFPEFLEVFAGREKIDLEYIREILDSLEDEPADLPPDDEPANLPPEPKSGPKVTPSKCSVPSSLGEAQENAFYRMVGHKGGGDSITSRIVRQFGGDVNSLDEMLPLHNQAFLDRSIPFGFVDHANNPTRLNALSERCLRHFCRHFDPNKGIPEWRREKDRKDKARAAYHKQYLTPGFMKRFLHTVRMDASLDRQQTAKFESLIYLMFKFDHRVEAKEIYVNKGCPFKKKDWFSICPRLQRLGILNIPDDDPDTSMSKSKHVCRQWLIPESYLRGLKDIYDDVDDLLIREGEKKKKEYMSTPQRPALDGLRLDALDDLNSLNPALIDQIPEKTHHLAQSFRTTGLAQNKLNPLERATDDHR